MMGYGRFGGGRGFSEHGFGMFPHMIGMVFALVVLVILVIIAIKMIRHKGGFSHFHHGHGHHDNTNGNAMTILNERYAKGEINDEEYKLKKEVLTKT